MVGVGVQVMMMRRLMVVVLVRLVVQATGGEEEEEDVGNVSLGQIKLREGRGEQGLGKVMIDSRADEARGERNGKLDREKNGNYGADGSCGLPTRQATQAAELAQGQGKKKLACRAIKIMR